MKVGTRLLACAVAVGLIGGCTYNDVFEKTPAADRFTGLDEGLRQTTRLNLLVIHGMSTHKPAYSDDWTDGIATKLQLRVDESFTRKTIRIVRKQDRSLAGYLRVGQFVSEKKGTLRIYEVTWSPATAALKTLAFSYDDTYSISRNGLNKTLKRNLMNDAFGDAVQYMGKPELRAAMQYPVELSLCLLTNDSALNVLKDEAEVDHCDFQPNIDPGFGFAVLTHSLGSVMLFDVLTNLTEGKSTSLGSFSSGTPTEKAAAKSAVQKFQNEIYHIFMMANQLPLIHLAANQVCDPAKSRREQPAPLIKLLDAIPPIAAKMRAIVAFNDPNDLLSYPISACLRSAAPEFKFVDIEISVAKWGLYIPGSGMASHPLMAHTGYPENGKIIDLIACGSSGHCAR